MGMESCHSRHDAMAFYVNIRMSVRPGDVLTVHVLYGDDTALFVCLRGNDPVLAAFAHYRVAWPVGQEEIKCASQRIPLLLKFFSGGPKPSPCEDFDLSEV